MNGVNLISPPSESIRLTHIDANATRSFPISLWVAIEPDRNVTRVLQRRETPHISHPSASRKGNNLNDYSPLISKQISILFRSAFFHYPTFFALSRSPRSLEYPYRTSLSSLRQSNSRPAERAGKRSFRDCRASSSPPTHPTRSYFSYYRTRRIFSDARRRRAALVGCFISPSFASALLRETG